MRYFVRGRSDPPITGLYRIDFSSLDVERYYGKGIWIPDLDRGKVLTDINGLGGSWYDVDEIGVDEVENYRLILDFSDAEHKVWAYSLDFNKFNK